MKLIKVSLLSGPNIFHARAIIKGRVALEEFTEIASNEIEGFTERLITRLPGLGQHTCSRGRVGGFRERLEEGTYFGHIIEHVAIELSGLAGYPFAYGKTVWAGEVGVYDIALRYSSETATKYLLGVAVELVGAVARDEDFQFAEKLKEAKSLAERFDLGPSTSAIIEAADRRGIPWQRLDEESLFQLGWGKNRKLIHATETSLTNSIAVDICKDKELTKAVLTRGQIPVPQGYVVRSSEEALEMSKKLSRPLVIKPLDGSHGSGVSVGISSPEQIREAFRKASEISSRVLIEECLTGRDYRVLVVNTKVIAVSERIPAHVIGDGQATIRELVKRENEQPLRGEGHSKPLTKIELDDSSIDCLKQGGLTADAIPILGQFVKLKNTANLSTGGVAIDLTDEIHPQVREVCERAARIVGLDVCGVDLITGDITKPLSETTGGIIELNSSPGIRMHCYPAIGKERPVADKIVEMLYPEGIATRIPLIAVTGTNGKTTTVRSIAHVLCGIGHQVGYTTTDGIWIGKSQIAKGDTTGPDSTRAVLSDPAVDFAVLEIARGGLMRRGLAYDWSDIGIILNISDDHLGQDGLENKDDILFVKSLVAERVRPGGTIILNGEDPLLATLPHHPRINKISRDIVFFGLDENSPVIRDHIADGFKAYTLKSDTIVEWNQGSCFPVCNVNSLPITMDGLAEFQVQNVLATVAALRAFQIAPQVIKRELSTFDTSHNSGRLNLYRLSSGHVVMDYGHNEGALRAIKDLVSKIRDGRKVTGIFTVPCDRNDELLVKNAELAVQIFDRVIIREDRDRRGRGLGEVASRLETIARAVKSTAEIEVILDEAQALEQAIQSMKDDEVIFHFYEEKEIVKEVLALYDAQPVKHFDFAMKQSTFFNEATPAEAR